MILTFFREHNDFQSFTGKLINSLAHLLSVKPGTAFCWLWNTKMCGSDMLDFFTNSLSLLCVRERPVSKLTVWWKNLETTRPRIRSHTLPMNHCLTQHNFFYCTLQKWKLHIYLLLCLFYLSFKADCKWQGSKIFAHWYLQCLEWWLSHNGHQNQK